MKAAVILALPLAFAACKKSLDVDKIEMIKLVRPPLAISVPDWRIVEDARDRALGKYKVQRESREFVEVAWQGGEPMAAADLQALGRSLIDGFKLDLVEDESTTRPGELRYRLVATLGRGKKTVWMAMGLIQCEKTSVTVTVGIGTWSEKATRALYDKVIAGFRCIGASPDKYRTTRIAPSSTLPAEFGYVELGGNPLVVSADNRGVFVFLAGGDNSGAIREHPEKTLETIGKLFEMSITGVGKPREMTGLGGVKMSVVDAKSDDEPVVAAGYYCRDARTTFTLLAMKEGGAPPGELTELVTEFGCPGAGPAITERESACKVGATSFCPVR